jgi:DNA-directed RNA polymerase subunit H (RpoH/RPB5)
MDIATPTITEQMFAAYEAVRKSGITNMFDLHVVCQNSGLSRQEAMTIMKNYRTLTEQYPHIRKP